MYLGRFRLHHQAAIVNFFCLAFFLYCFVLQASAEVASLNDRVDAEVRAKNAALRKARRTQAQLDDPTRTGAGTSAEATATIRSLRGQLAQVSAELAAEKLSQRDMERQREAHAATVEALAGQVEDEAASNQQLQDQVCRGRLGWPAAAVVAPRVRVDSFCRSGLTGPSVCHSILIINHLQLPCHRPPPFPVSTGSPEPR